MKDTGPNRSSRVGLPSRGPQIFRTRFKSLIGCQLPDWLIGFKMDTTVQAWHVPSNLIVGQLSGAASQTSSLCSARLYADGHQQFAQLLPFAGIIVTKVPTLTVWSFLPVAQLTVIQHPCMLLTQLGAARVNSSA